MKLCMKILAIVVIAVTTYFVIGCAAPAGFSYQNVAISLTVQCSDCPSGIIFNPAYPVPSSTQGAANSTTIPPGAILTMPLGGGQGGAIQIQATVNNAPSDNMSWAIYPQPNLGGITTLPTGTSTPVSPSGSQVGTFSTPSGSTTTASGATPYYSTPSGVPVYSGAALAQAQAMGIPQGDVMLVASVPSDPSNPNTVTTTSLLIQVYNGSSAFLSPSTPTNPSGLTNPVVSVAHAGGSYQFYGGVVGTAPCTTVTSCTILGTVYPNDTTDNSAIWEVGPAPFSLTTAVPGGNACFGTITVPAAGQAGNSYTAQAGYYYATYTAPSAIPTTTASANCTTSTGLTATAGEVVVVLVSHALSTVKSYAYLQVY